MKSLGFVVLAFFCQACRSAPNNVVDLAPPAASTSSVPAENAGPPDVPMAEASSCAPALVIPPSALATQWPALVGRRVRLRVRPSRALSVDEWLVTAGGQRFVALAAPDTRWTGEHTFIIAGSTIAPAHGRTAWPELVLDDDCTS